MNNVSDDSQDAAATKETNQAPGRPRTPLTPLVSSANTKQQDSLHKRGHKGARAPGLHAGLVGPQLCCVDTV